MNGTRHGVCAAHERAQHKYTAGGLINGADGVFNCIVVGRAGLCASDCMSSLQCIVKLR